MALIQRMMLNKAVYILERLTTPLSRIVNSVGIYILLLMMVLTVLNVFLRYFLKAPIQGAYEITEFTMIVVVFLALAYTMVQKGHVGVDLLVTRLSPKARNIACCAISVLGLGVFFLITWQSIVFAREQWIRGVTSAVLFIPVFPFILLVAFGSALLCLVLMSEFLNYLSAATEKRRWTVTLALLLSITIAVLLIVAPILLRQLPFRVEPFTAGLIGIGILVVFLLSGMPVAFVMALVGFIGVTYLSGPDTGLSLMGRTPYSVTASETLSVIPLFVLMGLFVFQAGLSKELYFAAYRWIGHLPGGLDMAAIGACAAFSTVCGSSPATAATMGSIVLPEMRRYRYDPAIATGSIAAGGTLGILIPPSVTFCVIGLIAEQSIGRLFLAGFLPGILLTILFMLTIYVIVQRNVILGPPAQGVALSERLKSLKSIWGIICLFLLVIGGIYIGIFTPTEAAGIGAFGALIFAVARKKLTWQGLNDSLLETGKTTAMILTIIFGAMIFGYFLTITKLPTSLASIISTLPVNRYIILSGIVLFYILLGCFMEGLSMIILTVPITLPIIVNLGFDPIWYGVILVIACEMGLITPPVGVNVYIIAGLAKDIPMFTVFRGIVPFLLDMIICVIILTIWPQIALFLPNLMKGG